MIMVILSIFGSIYLKHISSSIHVPRAGRLQIAQVVSNYYAKIIQNTRENNNCYRRSFFPVFCFSYTSLIVHTHKKKFRANNNQQLYSTQLPLAYLYIIQNTLYRSLVDFKSKLFISTIQNVVLKSVVKFTDSGGINLYDTGR